MSKRTHPFMELTEEFGRVYCLNDVITIPKMSINQFRVDTPAPCEKRQFFEDRYFQKHTAQSLPRIQEALTNIKDLYLFGVNEQKHNGDKPAFFESPLEEKNVLFEITPNVILAYPYNPITKDIESHKQRRIPYTYQNQVSNKLQFNQKYTHRSKTIQFVKGRANRYLIKTHIPKFATHIPSQGYYLFDDTVIQTPVNITSTRMTLVAPPAIETGRTFANFFVFSGGEICFGENRRWSQKNICFSRAYSHKNCIPKVVGALQEAEYVLRQGYSHSDVNPVLGLTTSSIPKTQTKPIDRKTYLCRMR